VPADEQARLAAQFARNTEGTIQPTPPFFPAPTTPTAPFQGDGGLYSTARDYGKFMRMVLNGGALGDVRILQASTVEMMGSNQIGDLFVEKQDETMPNLSHAFPLGAGVDKFGFGFQLTRTESGGASRSVGSMAWAGLFNTEFWIDPAQGLAGTHLMQLLPFYDEGALHALQDFETAAYLQLVRPVQ
jgi:methyl acetate hydrolase